MTGAIDRAEKVGAMTYTPPPAPRKSPSPVRIVAFVAVLLTVLVCAGFAVAALK